MRKEASRMGQSIICKGPTNSGCPSAAASVLKLKGVDKSNCVTGDGDPYPEGVGRPGTPMHQR